MEKEIGIIACITIAIFSIILIFSSQIKLTGMVTAEKYNFSDFEYGIIEGLTDQSVRVDFKNTYSKPIVIAKPLSYRGIDPSHIRIIETTSGDMEIKVEEWDYLDKIHSLNEKVGYLVIEQGVHEFDGKKIQAGKIDYADFPNATDVSFPESFDSVPIVLAQVQSFNGIEAIIARVSDVTKTGFKVRLQEQESYMERTSPNYGHSSEVVGWVAFQRGSGEYGNIKYVISSLNGFDHNWKTVSLDREFTNPVLLAGIQSVMGGDTAGLRSRDWEASSFKIMVEEEQSADTETEHTYPEKVGWIYIEGEELIICTDSDGGKNYTVKGTASSGPSTGLPATDFCIDSKTLNEYYCDGFDVASEEYDCEFGCSDGRCVEKSCTDDDATENYPDGKNYFVKGNTIICIDEECTEPFNDFCKNDTALYEYYCNSSLDVANETYICEEGCEDGACLKICTNDADCDDENDCTEDECVDGFCQNTPIVPCCGNGECEEGEDKESCPDDCECDTDEDCDDNIGCTIDSCENGNCVHDDSNCECLEDDDCSDGNICTDNYCNLTSGECYFVNHNRSCNDDDPCTINDRCNNGICSGTLKDCDDGIECTNDYCQLGYCMHDTTGCPCESNADCEDGNICTDDICNIETHMCELEYNNKPCDDNNPNTINDVCTQGICIGQQREEPEEEKSRIGPLLLVILIAFLVIGIVIVTIIILKYMKKSGKSAGTGNIKVSGVGGGFGGGGGVGGVGGINRKF